MENSDDEYLPARLASQLQMSLLCTNTRLEESDLPFTVVDQVHVWVTFEEEEFLLLGTQLVDLYDTSHIENSSFYWRNEA